MRPGPAILAAVVLALTAAVGLAQDRPEPGLANILQAHLDALTARQDAHVARFGREAASETLAQEFEARGVEFSARYDADWGETIGLAWSEARPFYTDHIAILRGALLTAGDMASVDRQEVEAFQRGVIAVFEADVQIEVLLESMVALYADLGVSNDRRREAIDASFALDCGAGEAESDRARCAALAAEERQHAADAEDLRASISDERLRIGEIAAARYLQPFTGECRLPDAAEPETTCLIAAAVLCEPRRRSDPFLGLEGTVGYVISNNARLVQQRRNIGARTVALLSLNERVLVIEGAVGDPDWVRVRNESGAEGWMYGNALRDEPLEGVPGRMEANDRRYSTSVGVGCKG